MLFRSRYRRPSARPTLPTRCCCRPTAPSYPRASVANPTTSLNRTPTPSPSAPAAAFSPRSGLQQRPSLSPSAPAFSLPALRPSLSRASALSLLALRPSRFPSFGLLPLPSSGLLPPRAPASSLPALRPPRTPRSIRLATVVRSPSSPRSIRLSPRGSAASPFPRGPTAASPPPNRSVHKLGIWAALLAVVALLAVGDRSGVEVFKACLEGEPWRSGKAAAL